MDTHEKSWVSILNPRLKSLVGTILAGRYAIVGVIGHGGMGAVFEANQLDGGRRVAIKVMDDDDPVSVKRFKREARMLTQMRHVNVVKIFDFGQSEGYIYLVMEHLEGCVLSSAIRRYGALGPHAALSIAAQVAGALSEAHNRGVIHRDIKPGNIFLTGPDFVSLPDIVPTCGRGCVKVLDFGIAKALSDVRQTQLTRDGSLVGTPLYMAPEQIRNRDVGAAADVYSVGVVLFEMLSGVPPFASDNMADVLVSHLQDRPPSLSKHLSSYETSEIPPQVDALLERCLAKAPEERYVSMGRLLQDLLDCRALLSGEKRPRRKRPSDTRSMGQRPEAKTSRGRDSGASGASRGEGRSLSSRPEGGVRKGGAGLGRRAWGAIVALAAVLVLVAGAWFVSVENDEAEVEVRPCAVEGIVECVSREFGSAIEVCRDGSFAEARRCPPESECVSSNSHFASCGPDGTRVAVLGGPCEAQGESLCDLDERSVLECRFGAWKEVRRCAPLACRSDGQGYSCESNVYTAGDDCDFDSEAYVCASDRSAILSCVGEQVQVHHTCVAGKRCEQFVDAGEPVVTCVGEVGDGADAGSESVGEPMP